MKKVLATLTIGLLFLLTVGSVCSACIWVTYQPKLRQI
ncbi:MAG: cyclic lactone autoinducer peptide [Bacillota bacterium]